MKRLFTLVLAVLAWSAAAGAVPGEFPTAAGRWEGAIDLPGQKLEIVVRLADGGGWSGTIDIPAQGARMLPLSDFAISGSAARFSIAGIPGDPIFEGALSGDGTTLSGRFTQGGQVFPFRLTRGASEAAPAADGAALDGLDARGRLDTFERKKGTKPAHALEDYVGEYAHPAYGTIAISLDGPAKLKASFHGIALSLEHWHYETFQAIYDDPAFSGKKVFFLFRTNMRGDVDGLVAPLGPETAEIVFAKKPPARLSDPAFLKTLEGTYVLVDRPSVSVAVALEGDALVATVTGQPAYHLEPYRGTEFRLRELPGYAIRFTPDVRGPADQILLIQPDGVFAARRRR